jgi:hypothetical protein
MTYDRYDNDIMLLHITEYGFKIPLHQYLFFNSNGQENDGAIGGTWRLKSLSNTDQSLSNRIDPI